MRYPASEKLEIIRTVEGSHLPTKLTRDMLGIPRTTFYRWYDLYVEGGYDALADRSPCPKSVWNRIPQDRRDDLDLSRFRAAPGARLGHLPLEGDRAFPTQC